MNAFWGIGRKNSWPCQVQRHAGFARDIDLTERHVIAHTIQQRMPLPAFIELILHHILSTHTLTTSFVLITHRLADTKDDRHFRTNRPGGYRHGS